MIPTTELAPSTVLAYRSDLRSFESWAVESGYSIDITTDNLLAYLDFNRDKWAATTLQRRAFALASIAQQRGLPNPVTAKVLALLSAIQRRSKPVSASRPLLLSELKKILAVIPATAQGYRDKCLLVIGWWGAMRRSEIVALYCSDVREDEKGLVVTIRRSKTTKRARNIALPKQQPASVCPFIQLINWKKQAGLRREGYLFRAYRGKQLTLQPLTGGTVGRLLKKWAEVAGLETDFSAHSLRSGYITETAMQGIPVYAIQQVSRHASARGVEMYIRPGMWEHNPSIGLGLKILGPGE